MDQRNVGSSGNAPDYIINNNIIAAADLTVYGDRLTMNGSLNAAGSVTLTGSAASNLNWQLTPTSSIAGNVTVSTNGTSGGQRSIILGANEQIGGSVSLVSDGEGGHISAFTLNGFNETINGLQGDYEPNTQNEAYKQQVRNGAATDSTLTIGNNNASSSFLGRLTDGGAGVLNLTKIGSGTQTFTSDSNHTGTTTIDEGAVVVDFTQYAPVQGNTAQDYFSPNSDLVMNGGTSLLLVGRDNGVAYFEAGAATQQFANYITLADTTGLVVGQQILIDNGANPDLVRFIVNIDGTRVYTDNRTGGGARDVTIEATTGATVQNIKSLTLSGGVGENVTLDFGSSDSVQLIINSSPVQLNDGSTITLANWSGSFSGGSGDQWLFAGEPVDFTSVFSQSEVIFDGFGPGYSIIDGAGIYEVVAVPEPAAYALLTACGALLVVVRRRRLRKI